MTDKKLTGAEWEISIDGVPRTYRDVGEFAFEAARSRKGKTPHSEIAVANLRTGVRTLITEAARPAGLEKKRGSRP